MNTQLTKCIQYCYPSSNVAKALKEPKGCYYITKATSETEHNSFSAIHSVCFTFSTLWEALQYADKIELPFAKFSLTSKNLAA